jgi:hypothetical protein
VRFWSRVWFRCGLTAAVALLWVHPARADVSSWLFLGGGASELGERHTSRWTGDFALDLGLGSPPTGSVIVGGVARFQPHFGYATDFGLSLRTTTRGFSQGDWGAALDLGGYLRAGRSSGGGLGSLVLGGPWGLVVMATASYGTKESHSVSLLAGIDFARLTVYRRTGGNWWRNPLPPVRTETR